MSSRWQCVGCCWYKARGEDSDGKYGTCHVIAVGPQANFPKRYEDDFCPAYRSEGDAPWANDTQLANTLASIGLGNIVRGGVVGQDFRKEVS